MYLLYADESGDPGAEGFSAHYILSALVIPAVDWSISFDRYLTLRRHLKATYGLPVRSELHAAGFVDTRVASVAIRNLGGRRSRMRVFQDVMQSLPTVLPSAKVFSVFVDKQAANASPLARSNYLQLAWNYLLNRYHTLLTRDCASAPGILIADNTANATVTALLRRMRVYNPLASHFLARGFYNAPVRTIIEDPVSRQSQHSYFVQIADMIAHSLYRRLYPKGSYRQYNLQTFYDYLDPILHKAVTSKDPLHMAIVRIP
jgi:hypothetical protein